MNNLIKSTGVALLAPKSSRDNMSLTPNQTLVNNANKTTSNRQQFLKDKKDEKRGGTHEAAENVAKDGSVTVIEDEKTRTDDQKTWKSVIVIGHSLWDGIEDRGLSKQNNINVCPHPGATTRDIADHNKASNKNLRGNAAFAKNLLQVINCNN